MLNVGVFRRLPRNPPRLKRTLFWRQPGLPSSLYTGWSVQGTLYTGSGYSLQQAASPAVVIGDTFLVTNTSPGGYAVTVFPDGTIFVNSGSDLSRQQITVELYRRITGTFDGPGTVWINEVAPVWQVSGYSALIALGQPFTLNVSIPSFVISQEGDPLTFTIASGSLPAGLTLSTSGILSGIPTGSGTFTILATDITGQGTASPTFSLLAQNATDNIRVRQGRRLGRPLLSPNSPKDWQSVTAQEAAKLRRIARKLRLRREGREEEEARPEETPIEAPAAPAIVAPPPAPADHAPLHAALLAGRHAEDDKHVMALHEQLEAEHHRAFHAIAAYALRLLGEP